MRLPRRATIGYVVYLLVVAVVGGYTLWVGQRSLQIYRFLKSDHLGFRGRVHRVDPEVGFAAVPSSYGQHVFPVGPPLPMHYDEDGFRVPAGLPAGTPRRRPLVLALGCSFTYGDACVAEDTYPHLVAQRLGGTELNAGKCAYGLSQMLLLARQLIPRHRPEYVIVQFSTWLPGRGTSGFARSSFGRVPTPFLAVDGQGQLRVERPAFRSWVFDLPFDRYDDKDRGPGEFLSFLFRAAGPLLVHDDASMLAYRLRRGLRTLPEAERQRAARNREETDRQVYAEIGDLCRRQGATMVIVRLSNPLEAFWPRLKALSPGALIVNAQRTLDAQVPAGDKDAYYRMFGHWRGTPPVLVDTHPNPRAHQIIADQIVRTIEGARGGAAAEPPS